MALNAERLLRPLFPSQNHDDRILDNDYGTNEGVSDVKVVFTDYQGWWAPLTHLFYSNASQCLVSAHPESSIEEVESFYCSHCLNYFADAEAASSYHRCPRCFDCPQCTSALLIISVDEESNHEENDAGYTFRCGYCRWSSADSIGLIESTPEALIERLKKTELDDPQAVRYRALLQHLRQRAVAIARARRHHDRQYLLSAPFALPTENELDSLGIGPVRARARWHLSDLEEKEDRGQAARTRATDGKETAYLYTLLTEEKMGTKTAADACSFSAEDVDRAPASWVTLRTLSPRGPSSQTASRSLYPPLTSHSRPRRRPLCTKRVRRCRQDVEAGRPGILLKPKVNPLEGDSSWTGTAGKWWQKDSSAIHVLPSVSVIRAQGLEKVFAGRARATGVTGGGGQESDADARQWAKSHFAGTGDDPDALSFVLRLRNPLRGAVQVVLVPPPATSEGAEATTELYYLRRLPVALGGDVNSSRNVGNVLYARVSCAGAEQAVAGEAVDLEAFEDDLLEEEEEGEDQESLDALALRLLDGDTKMKREEGAQEVSATRVLLRRKSRAWLHVKVPVPTAPLVLNKAAAVGVLLFLRFSSHRSELSHNRKEPAFITVPVCLAFTRDSKSSDSCHDVDRCTKH